MLPEIVDVDASRREHPCRKPPKDLPLTASVLAFDPGGWTGWSLIHVHPEALLPEEPDVTILGNIEGWQHGEIFCGGKLKERRRCYLGPDAEAAGINECVSLIRSWPGAAVVLEDFILQYFSADRSLLSPVRINSTIDQWLWWHDWRKSHKQPPSAKPEASDERLKEWGMYDSRGSLEHARDADRHALIFLRAVCKVGQSARRLRAEMWPHLYGYGAPYSPEVMEQEKSA